MLLRFTLGFLGINRSGALRNEQSNQKFGLNSGSSFALVHMLMNPVQTLMKPVQVFTKSVHMFRGGYWVLGIWDIGYYAQGRLLLETWNMRRYSI
jgi:hypothetical protein